MAYAKAAAPYVAVHLVEVAAHSVPAVPLADHVTQSIGLAQSGGGTEDVADRNRATPASRPGLGAPDFSLRATRSSYHARICDQSVSSALSSVRV